MFIGVWELPRVHTGRFLEAALSGWQASSIVHLNSGQPLDFRNPFDSTLRGSVSGRPDLAGTLQKLNPREIRTFKLPNNTTQTGNFLFDPTGFRIVNPTGPQEARQGTLGRNALTGPGTENVDLSLLRRFTLTEHQLVELRADVTNLFNHAQFNVTSPGGLMIAARSSARPAV